MSIDWTKPVRSSFAQAEYKVLSMDNSKVILLAPGGYMYQCQIGSKNAYLMIPSNYDPIPLENIPQPIWINIWRNRDEPNHIEVLNFNNLEDAQEDIKEGFSGFEFVKTIVGTV